MAKFEDAIEFVLKNEGGLVDDPNDPGGITAWGISLRFYKTIKAKVTANDIKRLTKDEAKNIYENHFWNRNKYYALNSQKIATKAFDMSVNCGVRASNQALQKAVMHSSKCILRVDGILGDKTIAAVNSANEQDVYQSFKSFQRDYYLDVLKRFPELAKYKNGWLKRASSDV